jgi:hypothetical protein
MKKLATSTTNFAHLKAVQQPTHKKRLKLTLMFQILIVTHGIAFLGGIVSTLAIQHNGKLPSVQIKVKY